MRDNCTSEIKHNKVPLSIASFSRFMLFGNSKGEAKNSANISKAWWK
jgi:hypothetical protein